MAVHALPDRERRHLLQFHVLPRLPYGARLCFAGGLVLLGLGLQLGWRTSAPVAVLFVTVPFILLGNVLLLVRGYDLRPQHLAGDGKWERTTRERFRDVIQLEERARAWDENAIDLTCGTGVLTLLLLAALVVGAGFALHAVTDNVYWSAIFVVDAACLLLPHWLTGTRAAWRPTALRQQVRALNTALAAIEDLQQPASEIQPMFLLKGVGEERTPTAARVFIQFPDAPPELLGLQFQVAINDVQGTQYPYLYAVIVARPGSDLLDRCETAIRNSVDPLLVEASSSADAEVLVIRRKTTKTSGYHTPGNWVRQIALGAWTAVARLVPKS